MKLFWGYPSQILHIISMSSLTFSDPVCCEILGRSPWWWQRILHKDSLHIYLYRLKFTARARRFSVWYSHREEHLGTGGTNTGYCRLICMRSYASKKIIYIISFCLSNNSEVELQWYLCLFKPIHTIASSVFTEQRKWFQELTSLLWLADGVITCSWKTYMLFRL